MVMKAVLKKKFITQHSSFSMAFSVHSNVHIFAFLYVLTFQGQHLNVRHLYQSYLCCLQQHSFSLKSACHQTAETALSQNGSHANSGPERSIHTMKTKNLFDLSHNMSPKAGVWVPSVLWGSKFQFSFQAFHPYLELWRGESNEFWFC